MRIDEDHAPTLPSQHGSERGAGYAGAYDNDFRG
jgi:hypothetical protein